MHANVQTRFNPAVGEKAPYYRLKESYRDVRGNVHSLILLNVGFDPSIDALQANPSFTAKRVSGNSVLNVFGGRRV